MKGKRYNTEGRFRLLREAEKVDKSIIEVCKDKGIKEAQRLRDIEKENSELKKLLAEQMLKSKALEIALEKNL